MVPCRMQYSYIWFLLNLLSSITTTTCNLTSYLSVWLIKRILLLLLLLTSPTYPKSKNQDSIADSRRKTKAEPCQVVSSRVADVELSSSAPSRRSRGRSRKLNKVIAFKRGEKNALAVHAADASRTDATVGVRLRFHAGATVEARLGAALPDINGTVWSC